jgi:trimeric autotransporter adhesin
MKNRNTLTMFTTILLVLVCFGVLPKTEAVLPAPDGGYGPPAYGAGNTAEGQDAVFSLGSGFWNTALGFQALYYDTTGSINTAAGYAALHTNITGDYNTAYGSTSLYHNTHANFNTAIGHGALFDNTIGERNTALGSFALGNNFHGIRNTATGYGALYKNDNGYYNTANGYGALYENIGSRNTAVGYAALYNSGWDDANTAVGYAALYNNNGDGNTATGYAALYSNMHGVGSFNTATGREALYNNSGWSNTANGYRALYNDNGGDVNTAIGVLALQNNTTGESNTAVGHTAGTGVTTAHHVICIGAGVSGLNVNNSCYIGSIFGAASYGGTAVFINSDGKLGTSTSSGRFKDEIKPMDRASEALLALKPVTFRYKKEIDPGGTSQFGLVAEDVEKINPDLVVRDQNGKPYSVRYDQVNAMLLNEFLKEHKKVQEQGLTITELKSLVAQQEKAFQSKIAEQPRQIEALASDLRKVSARLDLQKPEARAIVKY